MGCFNLTCCCLVVQGVVYETLDMSALPDYTVGGTIHLVVNNQAGAYQLAPCRLACQLSAHVYGLSTHTFIGSLPCMPCGSHGMKGAQPMEACHGIPGPVRG